MGSFLFGILERKLLLMKFKVMYGIYRKVTLIGDDKTTPHTIYWFVDRLIELFNMKNADKEAIKAKRKEFLKSIRVLEVNSSLKFINDKGFTVAIMQRVDDDFTMRNLINEVLYIF